MYIKIALSVLILFISNCTEKRSNFYVFNEDTETIDSLHIFVGEDTYLIEDLKPKTSEGIKVHELGGQQISLQADNEKPMPVSGVIRPPFIGTQKLTITKNRITSVGVFAN